MKNRSSVRLLYLLTVISPLMAVYFAVRDLAWAERKALLILAITLFGSTIILHTSDGFVLKQMIYDHYVGLSLDRWYYELKEMLLFSPEPGTKGDVFSHVSSYFFGQFLGVPSLYFAFISFVYGFLYVHALSKILKWSPTTHTSSLFWVLIIIFVSYRFIDELQTVRTWTGLWVLFHGVYGYHETRKLKYVFLVLAAPLFHIAYFLIAIPAVLGLLSKWINTRFLVVAYGLSFFIQVDTVPIIQQLETTDLGEEKVAGYYREDPDQYWDPLKEKSDNWYKKYGRGWSLPNAPHLLTVSLIFFGLFSRRKMNNLEIGLFSTGLLMAVCANLGDFIPAFYNRAMVNAGIYIAATTVLLLLRGELLNATGLQLQFRKSLLWICSAAFVPYLIYVVANMLQFTSVFMLSFPFFGFFSEVNISVRDFIRYIF